jgi:hypothetical protein
MIDLTALDDVLETTVYVNDKKDKEDIPKIENPKDEE